MKIERKFKAIIDDGVSTRTIAYPLTVEFDIVRDMFSKMNTAKFTFKNLNETSQAWLYHDKFFTTKFKTITFQAGYNDNYTTIYKGNIVSGYSQRQGTEMNTQIECFEGAFDYHNNFANASLGANSSGADIINNFITSSSFEKGYIASTTKTYTRGYTYQGNILDGMRNVADESGCNAFVDLGVVNVLGENDVIESDVILISPQTGLLNTPIRQNQLITLEMVFEPRLKLGQLVRLDSSVNYLDGQYKILGISHSGNISGAIGGKAITKLSLWSGGSPFNVITR